MKGLVHLNGNSLCAIDVETTGRTPGFHEIVQIAIMPLDNWYEPRKDVPIYEQVFCPKHIERIDYEAINISKAQMTDIIMTGKSADDGEDLFYWWFDKIKIPEGKSIVPLGYNVSAFDLQFIRCWLGETAYQRYFFGHARDVMTTALFLMDVSDFQAEQAPFNGFKLSDVALRLDIEVDKSITHNPVYDAYIAAQCYKKMLGHYLLEGLKT